MIRAPSRSTAESPQVPGYTREPGALPSKFRGHSAGFPGIPGKLRPGEAESLGRSLGRWGDLDVDRERGPRLLARLPGTGLLQPDHRATGGVGDDLQQLGRAA